MMSAAESISLPMNAHGAEGHTAPAGGLLKNEFRVIRGTDARIRVDENGNRSIVSEKISAAPEAIQVPYENFWNNFLQRQISYREKAPLKYDAIMSAQFKPEEIARIQRMMKEVPDEHGRPAKWVVDTTELGTFLQSKEGLSFTTSLVEDQAILEAAALGKEQRDGFDLGSLRGGYRLDTALKMWEFVNEPNTAEYLKEIFGVDVHDLTRPTTLGEKLRNPRQFLRANQVKETLGGTNSLRDSLRQANDAREMYYRDTLGYKGKLHASPAQFLIDYLYSNGKSSPEEIDTESYQRFLKYYEPNSEGIRDKDDNRLESRPGVRNPNFNRKNLDDQGNIKRFFEARSNVRVELLSDLLKQEDLDRMAAEDRAQLQALEGRTDLIEKKVQEQQQKATEANTVLSDEKSKVTSQSEAYKQYQEQGRALYRITDTLRGVGVKVEDGAMPNDVVKAIDKRSEKVTRDAATQMARITAALDGTTPPGPRAQLRAVEATYGATVLREEEKLLRGISYPSAEQRQRATKSATAAADLVYKPRLDSLAETVNAELAKIKDLETARDEKLKELREFPEKYRAVYDTRSGSEEQILQNGDTPKDQLATMQDAYAELRAGGINPTLLSDKSVEELLKLFKPGTGLFSHLPKMSVEQRRSMVVQAKAEQMARIQESRIVSPTTHTALYTEIISGVPRHGPRPAVVITPDELVWMDNATLRARLESDYGWNPRDIDKNRDELAKAAAEARQKLVTRKTTLADVKLKDIDEQIAKNGKVLAKEPSKEVSRKNLEIRTTKFVRGQQERLMRESTHVIKAIDEYTDTGAIDPMDATYSNAEKKLAAPRGYIKMLEYFGYDRNEPDIDKRNQQLEDLQSILEPGELAVRLYDILPKIRPYITTGVVGDVSVALTALRSAVQAGDIHDDDLRGGIRVMLRQYTKEAMQIE